MVCLLKLDTVLSTDSYNLQKHPMKRYHYPQLQDNETKMTGGYFHSIKLTQVLSSRAWIQTGTVWF